MNREASRRESSRRVRRRQHEGESAHERDRWLISYADLVTLLFALFVVLYAAADQSRARLVAHAIALEFGEASHAATGALPLTSPSTSPSALPPQVSSDAEGQTSLLTSASGSGVLPGGNNSITDDGRGNASAAATSSALAAARARIDLAFAENTMLSERARVTETERGLVVSLAEAGFFAPGEAAVRSDALSLLDVLAETLADSDRPLRIEGHTDSTPIATKRYPSNWELSAARSSNVLARLTARGISPDRLTVAGYADERPVADNSTPEGRAVNRRVDLVVLRAADY